MKISPLGIGCIRPGGSLPAPAAGAPSRRASPGPSPARSTTTSSHPVGPGALPGSTSTDQQVWHRARYRLFGPVAADGLQTSRWYQDNSRHIKRWFTKLDRRTQTPAKWQPGGCRLIAHVNVNIASATVRLVPARLCPYDRADAKLALHCPSQFHRATVLHVHAVPDDKALCVSVAGTSRAGSTLGHHPCKTIALGKPLQTPMVASGFICPTEGRDERVGFPPKHPFTQSPSLAKKLQTRWWCVDMGEAGRGAGRPPGALLSATGLTPRRRGLLGSVLNRA